MKESFKILEPGRQEGQFFFFLSLLAVVAFSSTSHSLALHSHIPSFWFKLYYEKWTTVLAINNLFNTIHCSDLHACNWRTLLLTMTNSSRSGKKLKQLYLHFKFKLSFLYSFMDICYVCMGKQIIWIGESSIHNSGFLQVTHLWY